MRQDRSQDPRVCTHCGGKTHVDPGIVRGQMDIT